MSDSTPPISTPISAANSPFNASGKTAASACGGALAVVYVLFHPGTLTAEGAGALGVASSIIFSYFHDVFSELLFRYGPKTND